MKLFIALLMPVLFLSACTATTRIRPDGYHHNHPHSNGTFCPPGQAKKGRC